MYLISCFKSLNGDILFVNGYLQEKRLVYECKESPLVD